MVFFPVVLVVLGSAYLAFSVSHMLEHAEYVCSRRRQNTEYAKQHPGTKTAINPAEDNCKKQCDRNDVDTKPNAITISSRQRRTYTGHASDHQWGGHQVTTLANRNNPLRVSMQCDA